MKVFQAAIVGGFSLVGCVAVQQQAVTPASVQPRPVPVAVRLPTVIQKTAAAGVPIMLDSASSVDPSCHSSGIPTAKVSQSPTHGTVKVLHEEVYPRFPPSNPLSACNRTKSPGIVTQYTSEVGFAGSDFTAIDLIFPDGKEAQLKFAITVK